VKKEKKTAPNANQNLKKLKISRWTEQEMGTWKKTPMGEIWTKHLRKIKKPPATEEKKKGERSPKKGRGTGAAPNKNLSVD